MTTELSGFSPDNLRPQEVKPIDHAVHIFGSDEAIVQVKTEVNERLADPDAQNFAEAPGNTPSALTHGEGYIDSFSHRSPTGEVKAINPGNTKLLEAFIFEPGANAYLLKVNHLALAAVIELRPMLGLSEAKLRACTTPDQVATLMEEIEPVVEMIMKYAAETMLPKLGVDTTNMGMEAMVVAMEKYARNSHTFAPEVGKMIGQAMAKQWAAIELATSSTKEASLQEQLKQKDQELATTRQELITKEQSHTNALQQKQQEADAQAQEAEQLRRQNLEISLYKVADRWH